MRINDAFIKLKKLEGQKISDLFNPLPKDLKTNKGITGQLIESYLGLSNSNTLLDFDDGELKTNYCYENGNPKETLFITQISNDFDKLLDTKYNFNNSRVFKKIKKFIYLSIHKENKEAKDWKFINCRIVDLSDDNFLFKQLEKDFKQVQKQLNNFLKNNGCIHTANGTRQNPSAFLHTRTKDSKPYHPIYSKKLKRYVSNKNHAFYFTKNFIKYIIS